MERLTERRDDGSVVIATKCPEWCEYATCSMEEGYQCQHQCEGDIMQRLADYEDAEEQGLWLKLPCKIGDRVYSVTRDFISEYTICNIEIYNEGFFYNWRCEKGIYINVKGFTNYDIGKTVFLAKEEAEKALADMGV